MQNQKKIIIVGAGISGLSLAYRLNQLRNQDKSSSTAIQILEASPRAGGVIETRSLLPCLGEGGADSFITHKPAALELCRELGLEAELQKTNMENARSYVLSGGRLRAVPAGFYLTSPTQLGSFMCSDFLSLSGKFRALKDLILPARDSDNDESVAAFVRRRFGSEVLDRVAQPMIGGIYGADIERLSLESTFPIFREMEKKGSVIAGLRRRKTNGGICKASGPRYSLFMTLHGGMESLIRRIIRALPEVEIQYATPVTSINRSGARWQISASGLKTLECDVIVLALPAPRAAEILKDETCGELSRILRSIEYKSAMTLNLVYRRAAVTNSPKGFGFVVPKSEKSVLVGCTFSGQKYAGRDDDEHALVRAFPDVDKLENCAGDEAQVIHAVHSELSRLLGIDENPLRSWLWKRSEVMPQYYVGHKRLIETLDSHVSGLPGLGLAGNAYAGIGIPDCIARSYSEAQRIHDLLEKGNL